MPTQQKRPLKPGSRDELVKNLLWTIIGLGALFILIALIAAVLLTRGQ